MPVYACTQHLEEVLLAEAADHDVGETARAPGDEAHLAAVVHLNDAKTGLPLCAPYLRKRKPLEDKHGNGHAAVTEAEVADVPAFHLRGSRADQFELLIAEKGDRGLAVEPEQRESERPFPVARVHPGGHLVPENGNMLVHRVKAEARGGTQQQAVDKAEYDENRGGGGGDPEPAALDGLSQERGIHPPAPADGTYGVRDPDSKMLRRALGRGASDAGLITRYVTDPLMGGTGMNVNFVTLEREA